MSARGVGRMAHRMLAAGVVLVIAAVIATSAHAACPDPSVPLQATIKFENAPADVSFSALPAPPPIRIVAQIENCSGAPIYTTEQFSSTDFFRRLYFTNDGISINKAEETLHSDAPTFFCQSRGRPPVLLPQTTPVVPVEVLGPQTSPAIPKFFREYVIEDARKLYDLSRPGHYQVKLQFDVLTFDPSDRSAVFNDCNQLPGTTVVNVGQGTAGRHELTIVSNALDFLISPAVAANSTIVGTSPVVADGTDTSTITITLKDTHNNPVVGVVPTFAVTGSNNTLGPCSATNASGVSTCTLSSTSVETKTLSIVQPVDKAGGTVSFVRGLGAARIWAGITNSDDVGLVFDLQVIVRKKTGSAAPVTVGTGQVAGVNSITSGFSNAVLSRIAIALSPGATVARGDTLSVEVLTRNACSGGTKISGRVRLWYDGASVDSGPERDAGTRTELSITNAGPLYFLRSGFVLNPVAGTSRTFIDKIVGAKCGAFQSFGVWSVTVQ